MLYLRENLDAITPDELSRMMASLPSWRREQAMRYRHRQGQMHCALGYLLLQQGISEEYGIAQLDEPFAYNLHGKPFLAHHPDIHFSISHCRQAVACFVSSHPVGLDVESIGRGSDSLMRHVLNEEERQAIQDAPALGFARLWTQKEAYYKLLGTGLRDDLRDVLTPQLLSQLDMDTQQRDGYVLTLCRWRRDACAPETCE